MFSFVNMKNLEFNDLLKDDFYNQIKCSLVGGRYITIEDWEVVKKMLPDFYSVQNIGSSVLKKPIEMVTVGTGEIKILVWSQMHGNEGTTTKAVFDLLNAFYKKDKNEILADILDKSTIYIIPVLNPDGAEAYTRVNANNVDLNRDMQKLTQPESKILMQQFRKIQPHYCLNLHDQRTIFSAGDKPEPATLSFLTPSKDEERTIDSARKRSMHLIAGIVEDLAKDLPGRIGRYDDAFNINCAGDTFQSLSTPTLLFEAGHYPDDYEREVTRKFVFKALVSCLYQIVSSKAEDPAVEEYFNIPENRKLFNDVIIRNALIGDEKCDIAIQFRERLYNNKVEFVPEISMVQVKIDNYAHREIDAKGNRIKIPGEAKITENVIVNKIIINNTELEVKYD